MIPLPRPFLVGVVHLPALPGAPRWSRDWEALLNRAISDARTYAAAGFSAVVVENFGDVPFHKDRVPPVTVAAMSRVGTAVAAVLREVPSPPLLGFNVLRNDAAAALALCAACGGDFIRVNVLTGTMVTDQGIIEGRAAEVVRLRDQWCPGVGILADILVKHAHPLGAWTLQDAAADAWERGGADALIVTGQSTGKAPVTGDLQTVRQSVPQAPLLCGSGATADILPALLSHADGVIVGSSLKRNALDSPVDPAKAAAFVAAATRAGTTQ